MTVPSPAQPTGPRWPSALALRWFEWLMASRLLRSRRSAHLSLVTALSVGGIALGVAALIVVLAVNTGFQTAFQERILASYPHLVVMQRGVDLRDYRTVAARLRRAAGVKSAEAATYDDMMLSSAAARAGAIVRGVGPQALASLPPGAIVDAAQKAGGQLVLGRMEETPRWHLTPAGTVQIDDAVSGGRHVVVVPRACRQRPASPCTSAPEPPAVLTLPGALGGVLVVDSAACDGANPASGSVLHLVQPDVAAPLRSVHLGSCGVLANWDVVPGTYLVHWMEGGIQREQALEVTAGRTTTLVVHGATASLVAAPPDDLAADQAAVVALTSGGERLAIHAQPDAGPQDWTPLAGRLPAVALGEGLAKRLQVRIGDEVRAVSPLRGLDRSGESSEGSANGRFVVSAILRTGFHDHDQRLALVGFGAAQRFLGRGDLARWVEARVEDPILATRQVDRYLAALDPSDFSDLLAVTRDLHDRLQVLAASTPQVGPDLRPPRDAVAVVDNWAAGLRAARQLRPTAQGLYRVIDWEEMNRNIFDAARMQKVAMSLFPFIIVLVAALNVVGTQAVVVHERAREIAILRAMGARRRSVATVFLIQGLVVGLLGTALGLALGGVCCWLLAAVGYPLDPQVYLIDRLPVRAEPGTFVVAGTAAVVLAFGAAWLAAQRAASRSPVEALRRLD